MAVTFEEACKILEVAPEASGAEVKTAYRKLAMKWHPDKHEGPEKENATRRFQQVSNAYQKLTTPEEDSIEIGDFQDAFQYFMRIFMAHCQDECFFDDDMEYDDEDLPYTSEEYYDTSEYSDDECPLDYQYLRDEKPPGFAKTAEEALKNAEELIREEEEQKRRLEKKKTKNKRKRTKNRKRKQANKIKTSSERNETTTPDLSKEKEEDSIQTNSLPQPPPPLPPPPPKPRAQSMGNGDARPTINSVQPSTQKNAVIPNGKIATNSSQPNHQQKPNSKKNSNPSAKPDLAPTNQTQKHSSPQNNAKQKNSCPKPDTNKRNSTHEESHRELHTQSAFVTVSRKKKKAFSTSGIGSNGSPPQLNQSPQTHKSHMNGTTHSKPPLPPSAPFKSVDHSHSLSSPIHTSPTSPTSAALPTHPLSLHPSKPGTKDHTSNNASTSDPPRPPANKVSNNNPDLPQRSDTLQQFNPIFNPMPSPYVEPYSEERGTLANTAHVDEAIHLAEQGNELASQEQFPLAIEKFTSAIFYNPKEYRYFGNRSLCYERLGDFETALVDAEKAIELRIDWPKGYFRRARALRGLKRFTEAEEALFIVQKIQGVSEDLECELNLVRALQLQEFGFTTSQSEKAMKRCTTYQQAIDLLIHGQISDSEDDNVYHSDDDESGYKRMFDPSWPVHGHYQSFHPQGASHPLSKHPHSTSSAQGNVRQSGLTEEPGTVASLWVGNIDVHMTEKELSELFSGIGRIQSVYFLPKIQGKNRAAFVNFTRADDAANAINALQGVEKYGKCLLLRYPDNPKPPESLPGGKVTCKFWLQGRCVRGNKCAFVHPRKSK